MSVDVYFGLGSNHTPEAQLRLAHRELTLLCGPLTSSPAYRNPAVGCDGADFLNMVVQGTTTLDPASLLAELERIHRLAGRRREAPEPGVWVLDIDLLLYGDAVSQQWKVPRPDILCHAFAARPMADIAPQLRLPVSQQTMAEIWAGLSPNADAMSPVSLDFLSAEPLAQGIL